MLCDHLEGWDGGWTGREAQEGGSGGIHIAGSHCYMAETNTIWESNYPTIQFSSVQSLSCVGTPRTAACQASVSITSSWSLLKLMSIESMMPSNHLILCRPLSSCPQSFPASGSFPMSWPFASGGQSIGVSASTSFLPTNIQDCFPFRMDCFYLLAV